jgi:hypothetical protein
MFNPTDAKRCLRRIWDAPIVQAVSEAIVGGRLNYFGLPGGRLEDIQDWRDHIGAVLALEQEKEDIPALNSNAMAWGLDRHGFHVEHQKLDDYVLDALRDGQSRVQTTWYHLLNLDYCGGWIYKDASGDARRLKAFDALMGLQRQAFFGRRGESAGEKAYGLLLMTLNVRSDDKGELPKYIRERIADQIHDRKLRDAIRALPRNGHEHWLLRFYVLHNVSEVMCSKGFRIYCFPAFWYRSEKSSLVHFAFLYGLDRSLVGVGQTVQASDTLLRLPLLTLGGAGGEQCVRVSEPGELVSLLEKFQGVNHYLEEAISLQRRGAF